MKEQYARFSLVIPRHRILERWNVKLTRSCRHDPNFTYAANFRRCMNDALEKLTKSVDRRITQDGVTPLRLSTQEALDWIANMKQLFQNVLTSHPDTINGM